jgi:hypothetical protein
LLATIFENAAFDTLALPTNPFEYRDLLTAFDTTLLVVPFATRVLLTVDFVASALEATAFVAVLDVSGLALLATMACLVAARLLIKDFFSIVSLLYCSVPIPNAACVPIVAHARSC